MGPRGTSGRNFWWKGPLGTPGEGGDPKIRAWPGHLPLSPFPGLGPALADALERGWLGPDAARDGGGSPSSRDRRWGGVGDSGSPGSPTPPLNSAAGAGAEGVAARSGAARTADKGSDRSPRPSPSPCPPATSAATAYLGPARGSSARPAPPAPAAPRRDPWAPASRTPRLEPGAAGVLRRSPLRRPRGPHARAGVQRRRRAQRGPRGEPRPRAPAAPPPRSPVPSHSPCSSPSRGSGGAGPRLRSPSPATHG